MGGIPFGLAVLTITAASFSQRSSFANRRDPPIDAIHSFTLSDDSGSKEGGQYECCFEVRPLPRSDAEEDEVEMLFPTRRRSFAFASPNDVEGPKLVSVRQTSFGCGRLGCDIWPSSIALSLHLASNAEKVRGRRVLELGAGCGLPSLICRHVIGASHVIATDFWQLERQAPGEDKERLVPDHFHGINLEHNVRGENASVKWLDWHNPEESECVDFGADLLVGSDLVYYPEDVEPLLDTLQILMRGNDGAKEAVLFSPLPVHTERKALPEFCKQLLLGRIDGFDVKMDEVIMHCDDVGTNDETFMRIVIAAPDDIQR